MKFPFINFYSMLGQKENISISIIFYSMLGQKENISIFQK